MIKHDFCNLEKVEVYTEETGHGFLGEAGTFPKRALDTNRLRAMSGGVHITESAGTIWWENENHYNYGGLAYRVALPGAGVYHVEVTTASSPEVTEVSLSGMQGKLLRMETPWDAAGKVARLGVARWREVSRGGKGCWVWSYDFACGNQALDVEVEVKEEKAQELLSMTQAGQDMPTVDIGLVSVEITPLPMREPERGERPTLFILGDSTAKSYVFEEAPMSSWGQILSRFFREDRVEVINYSQGARSLKTMYQEGRLNDILLRAKRGDYLLLQSGHNDEARETPKGIDCRFGRGNTAESFVTFLDQYFLPAFRARGMQPALLTCTTRMNAAFYSQEGDFDAEPIHLDGFLYGEAPRVDFLGLMIETAKRENLPYIDLFQAGAEFLQSIGGNAAKAMFLSLEPGETPGKTNSGSCANGHPNNLCDCAHYKESLSKEFARIIVTQGAQKKIFPLDWMTSETLEAVAKNDFSKIFPEKAPDIAKGQNAYYCNAIEKMIQAGVIQVREDGLFHPGDWMTEAEFAGCLERCWGIKLPGRFYLDRMEERKRAVDGQPDAEPMKICQLLDMLYDAYRLKFGPLSDPGSGQLYRPPYMTDYNGVALSPDDPNYDSNLVGESAQYYPLTPWDMLEDREELPESLRERARFVYELGLYRSEYGIRRGVMKCGARLEPGRRITRAKAAKYLYFLWVLQMPVKKESHEVE